MLNFSALNKVCGFIDVSSRWFYCGILFSILNKICDIVPEILIGVCIDIVVNQQFSLLGRWGIQDPAAQLYLVGGVTAVLWILESVFEYLYAICWKRYAHQVQGAVRTEVYSRLLYADMAYIETQSTGSFLSIVMDDVDELERFFSKTPNDMLQLIVNIIIVGAIFFLVSPLLGACALLPIPCIVVCAFVFKRKMGRFFGIVRERYARLMAHVSYRLQGVATIKSFTAEEYEIRRLQQENGYLETAVFDADRLQALYIPVVRMAVLGGFIATLVIGGLFAMQGVVPINWYAALVFLTQRFLWPFIMLTSITESCEKVATSSSRILSILSYQPSIQSGNRVLVHTDKPLGIAFKGVSFAYDSSCAILDDVDLVISPGSIVAFVGATGSGKSTLIKLIMRMYDASRGIVAIDNNDVRDLAIQDVRSVIAFVGQDLYMIDGTVAENIQYGVFNATRDDIIDAAKRAYAHEFIEHMSNGYDTKIYEQGKNLSGGQLQRIAIARAILKRSPILVFDEATSAVDNDTQKAIQLSINDLRADHTIILVAHRLSVVRTADVIVVLDKGRIVEQGNHDDLLSRQGVYARLWENQMS